MQAATYFRLQLRHSQSNFVFHLNAEFLNHCFFISLQRGLPAFLSLFDWKGR
uniref:Uncharacterized protein n=1 Tax=Arundo donax TaxID=35708 RepID=A0A0A9DH28_ARUDO